MSRVVIFCPNPYSLYTTTVAECLQREGIEIVAIVVRKFTLQRFKKEFARDGKRLLRKIINKLFLRENAYSLQPFETIVTFRRTKQIIAKKVTDFQHKGTIIHYCNDLNDESVVNLLIALKVDLVVFTGGGIIRQHILQHAGAGVVNCHMGMLPQYRGMDVVEWPILENNFDQLGCTVHFMDHGIDTGNILCIQRVRIDEATFDIRRLRDKYEPIMVTTLVKTVVAFLKDEINPVKQSISDGKQYFKMHDKLTEIANRKLFKKSLVKDKN